MRFVKATATTLASQTMALVFMVISGIIITRILGPSGKGLYTIVVLIPTLLVALGNLGIGLANTYFVGGRKYRWDVIASNSLILGIVLGSILIAGFVLIYLVFHLSFLAGIENSWILLALLTVPFSLLMGFFSMILLGQERLWEYNLIALLQSGLGLVLVFLLVLILMGGIFEAILAGVIATIVGAIFSILLVGPVIRIKLRFHPLLFKDSLVFGLKGHIGNVLQFLNYRLNFFLLAIFINDVSVGYYSVSIAVAEVLLYFPGAVGTVVLGQTPNLSLEEANRTTPVVCRQALFVTSIIGAALLVLGGYIISLLYGSLFLPAALPLWILIPGSIALSIPKILGNEITGRGRPFISTLIVSISFAFNLPLNIILIPMMGIAGAAIASTITYVVEAIITLIVFMRISNNSLRDTILIKRQDLRIYRNLLLRLRRKRPSA